MRFSFVQIKISSNPESDVYPTGEILFAVALWKQAINIPRGMLGCASDLSIILSLFLMWRQSQLCQAPT